MTVTVIELNDSEIRVAKDKDIILRSPGYAVLLKDKLELGVAATKLSRLDPRTAYNRYWNNLNQAPLQYPSAEIRHNADLAYAHLLAIHEQAGKPKEVYFAVPGYYSNEQLSLLLGLVEAGPFKAVGLVDSAVAAVSTIAGSGNYIHIEIHLHKTVLTYIKVSDKVSRTSVEVIDNAGLATIYDTCALLIADQFIKQARFDPQHHPDTEQELYNRIPQCLQTLQTHTEMSLEIQYLQTRYQAKLLRETLLETLQPIYQKIINTIPATHTCLIGDRLSSQPGFNELMTKVETLGPASVFQACLKHASHIRSSGPVLNFVTQLPATSNPVITESSAKQGFVPAKSRENIQPITHILHKHHAYPLTHGSLYLSTTGAPDKNKTDTSHCSVTLNGYHATLHPENGLTIFLNGQQINDTIETQPGDIISFAGTKTQYTFISVIN